MKILVVDDTKLSRSMLIKRMPADIRESSTIIQGENGEEAVLLYQKHFPELVFLDLTMPVMDGFDALALIMSHNREAKVHVVSADIQTQSRERVLKLGAKSLEAKPISEERMAQIFAEMAG